MDAGERLARARDRRDRQRPVVYNLFDQNPEDELFPACRERGVAVIARVPFDEGSLTWNADTRQHVARGDWRNIYFTRARLAETLDRVEEIEDDLPPAMPLPELALRFILANPDVTTVIPGMRSVRHVEPTCDRLCLMRAHQILDGPRITRGHGDAMACSKSGQRDLAADSGRAAGAILDFGNHTGAHCEARFIRSKSSKCGARVATRSRRADLLSRT
jgi:hypothetical protein